MKRTLSTLAGGLALLAASGGAHATTLQHADFADLVQASEACVVGSVAAQRSVRVNGQVMTLTDFTVSSTAFGDVGKTVTVATPGGTIQGALFPVVEVYPGSPRFFGGQDYMLLLDDTGDELQLAGTFQGVFPVVNGQVDLPGIGANLTLGTAFEAVLEQRDTVNAIQD